MEGNAVRITQLIPIFPQDLEMKFACAFVQLFRAAYLNLKCMIGTSGNGLGFGEDLARALPEYN